MKINDNLDIRAVADSASIDWVSSPLPGVDRKMLERDGNEVARVTSVVRYAPGSSFSPHTHTGGEEFIVLEGVFSDEMGDFEAGTYVRNPVGSTHKPESKQGCQIFVKLWQMPPDDQEYVRVNFNKPEGWYDNQETGESVLPLHQTEYEDVRIVRWPAGHTAHQALEFIGGAEYFVLEGSFSDEEGDYGKGTWLRLPIGAKHTPRTEEGCTVYIKTGHLVHDLPKPPKG